jgi:O-antigen/teichoic acid export membrane protein
VSLRTHLLRGVAGSLGLTVATAALSFVNGVLLARLLGVASYGVYASAVAVVLLLSVPLTLGFDRLLVREVAASSPGAGWPLVRGMIVRAVQVVLPVSTAVALAIGLAAALTSESLASDTLPVLWLALPMIPLLTMSALRHAVMVGLQRIVSAQVPDAIVRPGFYCIALILAIVIAGTISAPAAMALNLLSISVAFGVGLFLLWRLIPTAMRSARPAFETRRWVREALPFALAATALTVMNQIDVVMVGSLAGAQQAGLYAVASRGAALALFGAMAVNVTLAPTVARLWAQGERTRLQGAVTRASRGAFLFALAVALILWLAGPQFLLLFGQEFSAANQALAILAFAHLVDCGLGIGGLMLSMTGHQSLSLIAVASAVATRIVLDLLLIPMYGASGAAMAAVASATIFYGLAAVLAARRLGIDVTPLGIWRWTPGEVDRR